MTPAERIIAIAGKEVGYAEAPPNSNRTKFGKWFGYNGVAWCAMFVSWCYAQAGVALPKIGFSMPGFAGCQTAVAYFKAKGLVVAQPEPGDIVFYDWNRDGRYDHTGIFIRRVTGNRFEAIEGNTSLSNQSNGGQVMRRVREFRGVLFVRPKALTA